jgi:Rps23 Pro-64 3,4-dihydroxylase Tpa1-like proline 4-hydroxylase
MTAPNETLYDSAYQLNEKLLTRLAGPDGLYAFGIDAPVTVPLALVPLLSAFGERRTPREVFAEMETDLSLEELGGIIASFAAHGLVLPSGPPAPSSAPSPGPSLRDLLAPSLFSDPATVVKVSGWLREGRAVVIPDALPLDFAERVHRALDESTDFKPIESGHDFFHYKNSSIEELAGRSAVLDEAIALFGAEASRDFMSRLSGRSCTGPTATRASWYRPGEYALPHDDYARGSTRAVAYVWYLAKEWRQEWGGGLFWGPTGQYIKPAFNALVLFNVTSAAVHAVCPVSADATGKRLSINGFFSDAGAGEVRPRIDPAALVSPRAYGLPEVEGAGSSPLVVL